MFVSMEMVKQTRSSTMNTSVLDTARNELFACLDTPVEELLPPLTPDTGYEWRELANKVIGSAARFVAALEEAGGGEELHRRNVLLENLTGAPYQRLREAAYQRLRLAFTEASPDGEVERIPISQLTSLYMPEQFAHQFLVREDVRRFAGDPESILWSPFALLGYWGWLAQLVKYPELVDFCCEVSEVVRQIEAEHLWGSFLLAASRDVDRAPMPDRYRDLMAAIVRWGPVVAAIKDAVEDLMAALPVGGGQAIAEHSDAAPALPPVAPTQSVTSGLPNAQETSTAPIVGSGADEGSLSVTEAARITGRNKGTISRWREQYDLVAPDGRIDRIKLIEVAKKHPRRSKPARPRREGRQSSESDNDRDEEPLAPWEVVRIFLAQAVEATREQIVAHVKDAASSISEDKIDDVLKDPNCVQKRQLSSGTCLYRNPKD
jgi:hypothetical protein